MTDKDGGDFYEEDEPLEEVVAAFEQGEKGRTQRPEYGAAMALPAHFVQVTTNEAGVTLGSGAPVVVFVGGQVAHWVSKDRATANAE